LKRSLRDVLLLGSILAATIVVGLGIVIILDRNAPAEANLSPALELERRLGQLLKNDILRSERILTNPTLDAALQAIEERLLSSKPELPFPLELVVIDSAEANAYAFPAGLVVITSRMLGLASAAEDIAAVVAHELSHVSERDAFEAAAVSVGFGTLLAITSGGTATDIGRNIAKELFELRMSSAREERADAYAVELLKESRIHPVRLADMFVRLRKAALSPEPPPYLSSHPETEQRIDKVLETASDFTDEESLGIDWKKVLADLHAG
jgi:predicted Zn-dependent protease